MEQIKEQQPYNYNSVENPLEQTVILKLVLEQVGKADIADLYKCRYVNHFWNRTAVQVLEQQHHLALELDHGRILKFKSLLWRSQLSKSLSADPYKEEDEMTSLRISLKLLLNHYTEDYLSDVGYAAQLIMEYPYLRIGFIAVIGDTGPPDHLNLLSEQRNIQLFNLLKLASNHLTSLRIRSSKLIPRHFEKFDFENSYSSSSTSSTTSILFPRLTTAVLDVLSFPNDADEGVVVEHLDLTRHLVSIVKNSPKLNDLSLRMSDGSTNERIAQTARIMVESCSIRLERLEFEPGEYGESLKLLLVELQLPKLTSIRMNKFILRNMSPELRQLLKENCPSLTGLELLIGAEKNENIEDGGGGENIPAFPKLPKILQASLYSHFYFNNVNDNTRELLLSFHANFKQLATKFPSSESMCVQHGLFFMLGNYLKESGHEFPLPPEEYPILSNVSFLKVSVGFHTSKMFDNELIDLATKVYHHTFPNLKKMIIRPCHDVCTTTCEKRVTRFMEFLVNYPGLETLTIMNFAKSWFELIAESAMNLQFLQGLKRLSFSPMKNVTSPGIDLQLILTRFPALEFLQYGKLVVTGPELVNIRETIKKFATPISKKYNGK